MLDPKTNDDVLQEVPLVWDWSNEACAAFFRAASATQGRMNVRAGLRAALLTDLAPLTFTLARFWIENLTRPGTEPMIVLLKDDKVELPLELNRNFLIRACQLMLPSEMTNNDRDFSDPVLPAPDQPVDGERAG